VSRGPSVLAQLRDAEAEQARRLEELRADIADLSTSGDVPDPSRSLVAALLLADAATVDRVLQEVRPDELSTEAMGQALAAIAEVRSRALAADLVTVTGELRRRGRDDAAGAVAGLDLTAVLVDSIDAYARLVREEALRRSAAPTLERAARDLRDGARVDDVLGHVARVLPTRGALALAPEPETETWPARRPLPPIAAPVPTLPPELLPAALRPWLGDVAERVSVPLEFLAAPAIVGLGSVIGRSIALRPMPKDDFAVPANLWGGIIGPPGVMKTSAVDQALRPIHRLAALARKAHEDAQATRDADEEAFEARRKAIRGKLERAAKKADAADLANVKDELRSLAAEEAQGEVRERRFTTSDATIEKLGALLTQNPRGLLIVRDELTGWLRGLDREDRAQDRAFYLEAWNGTSSFTVDRIGRGTLHVDALCLSIVGGIQPGRLSSYVRGAIAGQDDADGLMQRIQMLVWPDAYGEWRHVDRWPARDARDRAYAIVERLADLDPAAMGAETDDGELPYLRFAPQAQGLFLEWRADLERRVRGELGATPAYESHLAKYRSLLPKLALVIHLVDVADGGRPGPVTLSATVTAAAWCDFLEAHARKVYAAELTGNASAAHALADRLLSGAVRDGVTVREVSRREWSGLDRSGVVYQAAEVLAGLGWLRIETLDTGGRPSEVLRLHPDLRRSS